MLMETSIIWKSSHVHWLRKRRDCLCLCGHGSNWKYRNKLLGNCRCIANGHYHYQREGPAFTN